jgi:hypothetical protein
MPAVAAQQQKISNTMAPRAKGLRHSDWEHMMTEVHRDAEQENI